MFPLLLVLIFIVVPIAELYVIIQVGQSIGALPTLAILIADSIVGAWLLRHQGRSAWRRFNAAVGEGRVPGREVLDGVMIIFGGAFLITPGFITDIIGILLLLPPTRAVFRRLLVRRFSSSFVVSFAGGAAGRRAGARQDYDVDGTAVERDDLRLQP
jgi:UPF0716 protein FxsA